MHKFQKIALGLSIIAAITISLFVLQSADIEKSSNSDRVATDPADIENPGRFIDYSEENFASAPEPKKVLFFHSVTCVTCAQIESTMNAGVMPEDVVLFKVQIEQEPELVEKYDIKLQTHFVQVDNNGDELKDWNWLNRPFAGPQELELEVI